MRVELEHVDRLRFADGSPVRAASAVTGFDGGLLVAQDDTTHAAWVRDGVAARVRLFAPVEGHDVFEEASGTKDLKPDLEAAVPVELPLSLGGAPAVLLLGSGSSSRRMRSALVRSYDGDPHVTVADLDPLYAAVADALGVTADDLNLEGACQVGAVLRWFHRGLPSAGLPAGSVDLGLAEVLAAASGTGDPAAVPVRDPRHYDLGEVEGVGLAVTDAVVLPDGSVLVSAAAEDAPNARDDGPVVGSALVRLDGEDTVGLAALPPVEGQVCKVEGITVLDAGPGTATVLGVVDADDPTAPSLAVHLRVTW